MRAKRWAVAGAFIATVAVSVAWYEQSDLVSQAPRDAERAEDASSGGPGNLPTAPPGPSAGLAPVIRDVLGTASRLVPGGPGIQSITFYTPVVISSGYGGEPTLTVGSDDSVWVAGSMVNAPAQPGRAWKRSSGSSSFSSEHPPNAYEGDATLFASSDGRYYWAAQRFDGTEHDIQVMTRSSTGSWQYEVFFTTGEWDRPWFFSIGSSTYVTSHIQKGVYKTTNGGQTWISVQNLPDFGIGFGQPAQAAGAGFFAGVKQGKVNTTLYSEIPTFDPGTISSSSNVVGLPWPAADGSGNLYVVWEESGNVLKFSSYSGGAWQTPTTLRSDTGISIYGSAAVATGTGKLAVAWYERAGGSDPWKLMYRQVSNAQQSNPTPSALVEIVPHVIDSTSNPRSKVLDFLTIGKLSDGRAVIAYACSVAAQLHNCPGDGDGHPMFIEQNTGA